MSIPLRLRYFSSLSMLMAASSVSAVRSNRYRHSVRVCRRSYAVGCTGVTLRNTQTGATLVATTDKDGVFQFPGVLVGSYSVQVAATGFKAYELNGISLSSAETRNLGRLRMEIGGGNPGANVVERDEPDGGTGETGGTQREGRDPFQFFDLTPGVVDTSTSRDNPPYNMLQGLNING